MAKSIITQIDDFCFISTRRILMISKGDLVLIYIPEESYRKIIFNRKLAKKYNNSVGYVSKVKTFYRKDGNKIGTYCEIEGCVSAKGVPYSFDEAWVSEVEDE